MCPLDSVIFYLFAFNSVLQLHVSQHVTISVLDAMRTTEQRIQLIPTFEELVLVRSSTNTLHVCQQCKVNPVGQNIGAKGREVRGLT